MTQGSDYKNRVGSRVKNKSIDVHIWPYFSGAGAGYSAGEVYRLMLIYDAQPNAAVPVTADVLLSTTNTTLATSPVNLTNRDRFMVLRDTFWVVPTTVTGTAASNTAAVAVQPGCPPVIHWYVKLRALETIYRATAGAIGDITSGALFVLALTESTTSAFAFSLSSRLRFYD